MTSASLKSSAFRRTGGLIVAAIALCCAQLLAHDMWIEPATFAPAQGQVVSVRLRVGQDFLGDPLALDPALVDQFVIEDATGRRPIVRRDGGDPAGLLRVGAPGLTVIGYSSRPSFVALTADKFNQYLKEEGLDAVAALRAEKHQTGAAVREAFSRCAKSFIVSGATSDEQRDHALGFTLELVAERNPYLLHRNDVMPLQLLYKGQPMANVLVVAMNKQDPTARVSARSDANGHVKLKLGQPGRWLIKAVHMIPAPAGLDADWSSYWASMTFDLQSGGPASSTR